MFLSQTDIDFARYVKQREITDDVSSLEQLSFARSFFLPVHRGPIFDWLLLRYFILNKDLKAVVH